MSNRTVSSLCLVLCIAALAPAAACAQDDAVHAMHHPRAAAMADGRQVVHFPAPLRVHTLANMRDHLLALEQIQEALGKNQFDTAADIAEARLGMSSMPLHGAHEVAPYMPEQMQRIGTDMHRAASQFALAAKNASVSGDTRPVFTAFSHIMQQCVACHSTYRVQ